MTPGNSKRGIVIIGAVVLAVVIVAGVVITQLATSDHKIDKATWGVSRDVTGALVVVVSACEPFGIGSVAMGVGPERAKPETVVTGLVDDKNLTTSALVIGAGSQGYTFTGALPSDQNEPMVVIGLTTADGRSLLGSPFWFDPSHVVADSILRGDGSTVTAAEWSSTAC